MRQIATGIGKLFDGVILCKCTHSRHLVTISHGYVRQRYRSDKSEFARKGQTGLFLYSLSELPETQGGEFTFRVDSSLL